MDAEQQHAHGVTPLGARERRHKWQPLGQVLIKHGLLSQERLSAAFERQRRGAQRLGRVLVEQNVLDIAERSSHGAGSATTDRIARAALSAVQ